MTLKRIMNRILVSFPELKQVDPNWANSPSYIDNFPYVVDDIYGGTFGVKAYDKDEKEFLLDADLVVPIRDIHSKEDTCLANKYFQDVGIEPSDYHHHIMSGQPEVHIHFTKVIKPDRLKDFITKIYEARAKTSDAIQRAEQCDDL